MPKIYTRTGDDGTTGLIGGKSVGMLLARAILKQSSSRWPPLLEAHDSFYVGADVFYTYLVSNGCWRIRQQQRDSARFLDGIDKFSNLSGAVVNEGLIHGDEVHLIGQRVANHGSIVADHGLVLLAGHDAGQQRAQGLLF